MYGGICALASFTREELKDKVINNPSFKAFLELLPWLRELISDFYSSNYASCLQTLETKKAELRLDMYLCGHVDALCQEIRHRGIIQYFYPYLSVDLQQMAQTFNTEMPVLEAEICELIAADKLHARMDSYEKVSQQKLLEPERDAERTDFDCCGLVDPVRASPEQAQRHVHARV